MNRTRILTRTRFLPRLAAAGLLAAAAGLALLPGNGGAAAGGAADGLGLPPPLARSLTFAATFDRGLDADFSSGDPRVHSAPAFNREGAEVGIGGAGVERVPAAGRGGTALKFALESRRVVFYQGKDNFHYRPAGGWAGTISYFLSLDPERDLPESWSDPIQITERAWNDASFWNDFTKDDRPRKFRLGVLADLGVWNPNNEDFDALPDAEKPAVVVERPPFAADRWTHVAVTFERFNTGRPDGEARLYLDGRLQGVVTGRNQQYTWGPEKVAIYLGLSYGGLLDDLMLFDRALTEEEVRTLGKHPQMPQ